MENWAWGKLKTEMINILDIYPEVKGLQIMNCEGKYMFSSAPDQWLVDSPGIRKNIIKKLDTWNAVLWFESRSGDRRGYQEFL